MILRKLMTAASVLALSATTASALTISTLNDLVITPATELVLPLSVPADFSLNTTTGTFYPDGTAMLVTITLPAGVTFGDVVAAANITSRTGTAPTGEDGDSLAATLSSGGEEGDSSAVFLVTATGTDTSDITYTGTMLSVDICPPAGATIMMSAVVDGSGTPVDGGTATSDAVIAPCASALDGEVVSDEATSDTVIDLEDGYILLSEEGAAATAGPVPLGSVTYTIDPEVDIDGDGNPMTAANITNATFSVDFQDDTNIVSVTVGGLDCPGGDADNFLCSIPGASLIGANVINVTVTGVAPEMQTQTVSVSNAVVTFANATPATLIATEPGATGGLDTLQREGQNFGVYDWNGSKADGTVSIYRVTGLTAPTTYSVIMTNSGADGLYVGTATPNDNGEAVITSVGFGAEVPEYERGDVQFIFETTDDLDVDRLLARNGIVTAFGDQTNND